MQAEYDPATAEDSIERACDRVKLLAGWIDSWVRASRIEIEVEWIRFKELTTNPAGVMGRILAGAGAGGFGPALQDGLQRKARSRVSSNFRRGDDEAWREYATPRLTAALWEVVPESVRDLLGLRP